MKEQMMELSDILRLTQPQLKHELRRVLEGQGYAPISQKGFLYAQGELPVLLVAHLDTVHRTPVQRICCSNDGRWMMSPEGIGGDDRCGVYMILEILRSARCHVLFCEDEETGGNGARAFANSKIRPTVNYIVEMDRRGTNDAVFYQCDNPEFTDFICSFGFNQAYGSFSDISVIAPRLGIAAVNISAGYFSEHSLHEYIDLEAVENNIRRITEMVQTSSEQFEYLERTYSSLQLSFETLSLWDLAENDRSEKSKHLMPLSENTVVMIGDYREDDPEEFLLAANGDVYRYIPELDAAILSENAIVVLPNGSKPKYSREEAINISVMPLEMALELLDAVS